MSAATTRYRVVTEYRTDTDGARAGLRGYSDDVRRVTRDTRSARSGVASYAASFGMLGRAALALGGSLSAGFVGIAAVRATFSNLNDEMNSTLAMASQLNFAFEFDTDPMKQWNESIKTSRELVRSLIGDAAKLPGEAQDFIGSAQAMIGIVSASGARPGSAATLDLVREMAANIPIVGAMANQSPRDAANQAARIVGGQAGLESPLFAMMKNMGVLPGAQEFNALPATERVERFSEAMKRLGGNEMFRKDLIGAFDTQLGTLSDNIFGATGLIAEAGGRDLFEGVLAGLTALNETLETKGPGIASELRAIGTEIAIFWDTLMAIPNASANMLNELNSAFTFDEPLIDLSGAADAARQSMQDAATSLNLHLRLLPKVLFDGVPQSISDYMSLYQAEFEKINAQRNPAKDAAGAGTDGSGRDGKSRKTPGVTQKNTVVQTNHIVVDLKSDDSPEAIAVRLGKAMEIVARHPRTSLRAPSLAPRPRSVG